MSAVRQTLFRYRSYTPIPFLVAMLVFALPTPASMLAGGFIGLLGEAFRFWGVAYAGALTRVTGSVGAPALIVAGPFARVRNPLYLGNILLYVGVSIMANALVPWLAIAALAYFSFQYAMIVSLEEEFLEKTFGEGYSAYNKAVPRFFPRLSPYHTEAGSGQVPDWKGARRSERRTFQAIALIFVLLIVRWIWT